MKSLYRLLLVVTLLWMRLPVPAQSVCRYVDPFIGSVGKGNVFVGPSMPFGMVKPGPDCSKTSNSGYVADSMQTVYGFSQIHVSGTGGGPKYGNILIMPFSDNRELIRHESLRADEKAEVGLYHVRLKKSNICTDISTATHASFYRFVFSGKTKGIQVDAGEFLGEKSIPDSREAQQFVGSEIRVISDREVQGYSRIMGGWNNGTAYTVYFHAVFDKAFSSFSTWKGSSIDKNKPTQFDSGEKTGALLYFDQAASDTVQCKIGISFVSELKAKYNAETEITHWHFNEVRQSVLHAWEKLLGQVQVSDDTPDGLKKMLYTALYHTQLMPVDRSGENPLWTSAQPYYDDFYAIWDTYRSSHPLLSLLTPSRQTAIVNAMLDIYKRDGYLPDARSGNCNGRTQGGSNAEVIIADAYAKGLKGIDYGLALQAMLKDATVPPGNNEEKEGRGGLTDYNTLGYVSTRFVRSGNRTVEYAYDDYCLAQVAKGLNRLGEYRRFIRQADRWKNLWRDIEDHGARGFIMPRDAAGKWVDSIPCEVYNGRYNYVAYTPLAQDWPNCVCWWCGFFYEASSWEYSFFVPHDVPELIEKTGGAEAFRKRLDVFFDNGYYNVGNEPSFLTPCLYHWIGRPDLSSLRIHQIIDHSYDASREGLPGNDDSGAMSSWLAFHLMGIYPNAGQSYYLITTPYINETLLKLENGRQFRIKAKHLSSKNCYIQSASLNGVPLDRSWIEHTDITNGGRLDLEMGPAPSANWGVSTPPPTVK